MFTVTLTADSFSDLQKKLNDLSLQMHLAKIPSETPLEVPPKDTPAAAVAPQAEEVPPVVEEKVVEKRVRTKKAVEVAPVAAPEPPQVVKAPITKEQVHAALSELNIKKGLPRAKEMLNKFGCQRLSEVPPERFEEFAEACLAAANE